MLLLLGGFGSTQPPCLGTNELISGCPGVINAAAAGDTPRGLHQPNAGKDPGVQGQIPKAWGWSEKDPGIWVYAPAPPTHKVHCFLGKGGTQVSEAITPPPQPHGMGRGNPGIWGHPFQPPSWDMVYSLPPLGMIWYPLPHAPYCPI